jgi:capsular polysaccharide biosynthesis protein
MTQQTLFAQSTGQKEDGKIYVVVAVIVAMFLGIVFFLITMERRIKKLEKMTDEL